MKFKLSAMALLIAAVFSCSSDKEDGPDYTDTTAITGTWDATQLETEDPGAVLQKQILAHLSERDCYILTFTFNEDLSLLAENGVNYLEVNATEDGLDIPCPEERNSDTGTYTYDGEILKIEDLDGPPLNAEVTIEGSRMTIDAKNLDIPNFDYTGKLIFRKR
ncbi:hypothetical protein RQM65_12605 [Pricia sp. S334]|uniref:Lipocalin-like domain-containing protein n=1 Tax=Pricia mediterranea TaxID=3076079 RepID=A0ABU3L8I4_9FLAO|nr:hypothetical protein [Pricia sp. S334]MDT7829509.1 hypothetical protein [Pricia sp. S334]